MLTHSDMPCLVSWESGSAVCELNLLHQFQLTSIWIVPEQVPTAGGISSVCSQYVIQLAWDLPLGMSHRLFHELTAIHQVSVSHWCYSAMKRRWALDHDLPAIWNHWDDWATLTVVHCTLKLTVCLNGKWNSWRIPVTWHAFSSLEDNTCFIMNLDDQYLIQC
jgi:hypothetical protein